MKQTSLPLGLLLAALLLAAGGLGWWRYREAAVENARITGAGAELPGQVAERVAETKLTQEVAPKVAVSAPVPMVIRPALTADAARPAESSQSAGGGAPVTANQVQSWLAAANNPAVMRQLMANAHALTVGRYGDFFQRMNFTSEQTEALSKLLDEKRQVGMDLAVANLKNGIDPRTDLAAFQAQITAVKLAIEKEIRSLLGEEGYAQLVAYNREKELGNTFTRLQRVVADTENALTADQTAKLQQLLLANGGTGRISPKTIGEAQTFLSPAQIQALQQAFEAQEGVLQDRLMQSLPPAPDGI